MRIAVTLLLFILSGAAFAGEAKPPMWRLADDDTTIYLFGTVHVLKPGTVWMTDEIQSALDGSRKLYLEVSLAEQQDVPRMQALVQKYGMLPEGETLSGRLPKEQAEKLKRELISLGLKEAMIERFKPWFAGSTYSSLRFLNLGYNPASGVEAALGAQAQALGIPVDGLETLEQQLQLFDSMSEKDTVLFIKDLLMDEGELSGMMTRLTESWAQGDLKALDDEINDINDISPSLADLLIYDRNAVWATEIEAMLDTPGQVFIAVGSGHFVGRESVIDYLEDAGLDVERVQ